MTSVRLDTTGRSTFSYVASLLRNKAVSRHLERHHPEILAEFRRIAKDASIGSDTDEAGV